MDRHTTSIRMVLKVPRFNPFGLLFEAYLKNMVYVNRSENIEQLKIKTRTIHDIPLDTTGSAVNAGSDGLLSSREWWSPL